MAPTLAGRQDARLEQAFLREQRDGIRMATFARLITLGVILGWVLVIDVNHENLEGYLVAALLALSGLAMWGVSRMPFYRTWHLYLFVLLDHALVAYAFSTPWMIGGDAVPLAMNVRTVWFAFFFIFIAGAAITQTPSVVVWSGVSAAICWSAVVLKALAQPDSFAVGNKVLLDNPSLEMFLSVTLDPHYVDLTGWISQVLFMILVSLTLAAAVGRSRRLVVRQIATERERANLARYFSPDVVDRLASKDSPLAQPTQRPVAILFADIVGFTALCENARPQEVIELLSEFRQRMETAVFENQGTVDKYIGDCVMATFGLLSATPGDAAAALSCARDMLDSVDEWNRERAAQGLPAVDLGIGVHYGPVTVGDIGGDRRVEFTVVGDTVNVASRLMSLTRQLEAHLVISHDLVEAAKITLDGQVLADFERADPMTLRGREGAVAVWYHRRGAMPGAQEPGIVLGAAE
ncbi:adenylate/guanylate cyclase domain-containing protein [Indioceanicola profundi]|uniref:adenylate/guanylate cyclase domain-containing protein n=1 Tax=Indioceanicola profundi TaxID=2220096 RepID=UPI000E6AB40D|nr:adenylate/guanylate cyclase domain-containing protein [Indioceanicola profundi]